MGFNSAFKGLTSTLDRVGGHRHGLAALLPEKSSDRHSTEAGWTPGPNCNGVHKKISRPHRCSNPKTSSPWRSLCTDYAAPYNEYWVYNSFLSAI